MTGDHVPLQAEPLRTFNHLRHVLAAGVEMLIEMEVEAPLVARREAEEKIQEGRRIGGMRGRAAYHIHTCIEGCLQPGTAAVHGSTPPERSATTCSRHAVVPPLAQLQQGLHPAQATVGSTLTCERMATVPRVRHAAIVRSARARISSRPIRDAA